jgi:uncharacterized protein with GYD domain
MESYVILGKFTPQGHRSAPANAAQLDNVQQHARAVGAEVQSFHLTLGEYDVVAVIRAPDEKTMAKLSLAIGSTGNLRTLTLRAFPETEIRRLMRAL